MKNVKLNANELQWVIRIGAALAFSLFFWILLIIPGCGEIERLKEEKASLETRKQLFEDIRRLQQSESEVRDVLLAVDGRHDFLSKISGLAKESGLEVISLEPSEGQMGRYGKYIMSLRARGGFKSLIRYLEALDTMKPIASITQMTAGQVAARRGRAGAGDAGGGVDIEMKIESYMAKKAPTP